jgi:Resolvase, N terminal domain
VTSFLFLTSASTWASCTSASALVISPRSTFIARRVTVIDSIMNRSSHASFESLGFQACTSLLARDLVWTLTTSIVGVSTSMAAGRFIAYYRVSTAAQGRSGLGLEGQRVAVAAFLNGGHWQLLGAFTEVESGANTTGRPVASECLVRSVLRPSDAVTHAPLFFSDHSHDAHRHAIGVRHVGGDEIDTRLVQPQQEMRIAAQSVELCDHQRGALQAAGVQSLRQLRPRVVVGKNCTKRRWTAVISSSLRCSSPGTTGSPSARPRPGSSTGLKAIHRKPMSDWPAGDPARPVFRSHAGIK